MGGFITSKSAARRHGAYAIQRPVPAEIVPIGSGIVAMVGQFPWGPDQELITPASGKDLYDMFAPAGVDLTGSGYLSLIRKAFPTLRIVRVLGTGKAKATATLASATPTDILTVTAKYHGTAANSFVATVAAASDADSNHFNLTVSVSGASGDTSDIFQNLNYSGTGSDSVPVFTSTKLVGGLTKLAAGRPANGTYTFSSGANGTIDAAAYVGTATTGDKGLALLEGDSTIRGVFVDDCGDSLRAAVNAGVVAHANLMGDRAGYINGDSGNTAAEARTDVASYRSEFVVYCDPWVKIIDDTGTERLVPPAPFAASLAAQLPASTSIAWKGSEVQQMLSGISSLEASRGIGAADNTAAGIATFIREENGGHTLEAAPTTIAPSDASKRNLARTRIGIYIATSFIASARPWIDAPNVELIHDALLLPLSNFLDGLKRAKDSDPIHSEHIVDWSFGDLAAENSPTEIALGNFTIPVNIRTSSGIEKLFLALRHGEGVTISNG